jgi:hypothetical protein
MPDELEELCELDKPDEPDSWSRSFLTRVLAVDGKSDGWAVE